MTEEDEKILKQHKNLQNFSETVSKHNEKQPNCGNSRQKIPAIRNFLSHNHA